MSVILFQFRCVNELVKREYILPRSFSDLNVLIIELTINTFYHKSVKKYARLIIAFSI